MGSMSGPRIRGRRWEFTAVADDEKTPPDMLGYLRGTNIIGFIWFYVPRIPENVGILILMMDINMGTKNPIFRIPL